MDNVFWRTVATTLTLPQTVIQSEGLVARRREGSRGYEVRFGEPSHLPTALSPVSVQTSANHHQFLLGIFRSRSNAPAHASLWKLKRHTSRD
jgi:hypothetical protein